MKKTLYLVSLFFIFITGIQAQDWNGIPVPANPPTGMTWELNPVSDSFDYESSSNNLHPEFTKRWNELYINGFSGPSATSYHKDHTWITNGQLNIHGAWDNNLPIIYTGCISSKEPLVYPMYMEARVKQAGCMLANNIWMISEDETEELDMLESYPNIQEGREYFDKRIHLSHHTFIRDPFTDYQPRDEEGVFGTWYMEDERDTWRDDYFTIGVYWVNPHYAEYYINGQLVRTIKSNEHSFSDPQGDLSEHTTPFDAIDKYGYTGGTGLSKPQHIIINMEQQSWLSDQNIFPTPDDLDDANGRNLFVVDWIRVYDAVPVGGRVPVTGIETNQTNITIRPGEAFDLTHNILPSDATTQIITWSVSNTTIAKINGLGQVTGISNGTVGATVKTFDGDFTDVVTVTVAGEPIGPIDTIVPVEAVSITPQGASIEVGETVALSGGIIPFNATIQSVVWSSSNRDVATVSNLGVVLAVEAGSANITTTTLDGNKTNTVTITVTDSGDIGNGDTAVTGNSISPTTIALDLGETATLTATVAPANATDKTVTWSSSNTSIASVNDNGLVTAQATGLTIITATTVDGSFTATSNITVNDDTSIPSVDEIVIEAEDFTNTGGTFDDAFAGGPGLGVNRNSTNIDYVNNGDWVEYIINVITAARYNIEYLISTPSSGAQIQLLVDGNLAATSNVSSNGDWDNFTSLVDGTVTLATGTHTIRIQASSNTTWQWNLDKIILSTDNSNRMNPYKTTKPIAPEIYLFPNPATGSVSIQGLSQEKQHNIRIYDIKGATYVDQKLNENHIIDIQSLTQGIYFLTIINPKNGNRTLKLIKK